MTTPTDNMELKQPLPCPFCGSAPKIAPEDPENQGGAWGEVFCGNPDCHATVAVRDGIEIADNRGTIAYQNAAIERWNTRTRPSAKGEEAKVLSDEITRYLVEGGLFNPEMAIHDNVRDLLIRCREYFEHAPDVSELEKERDGLYKAAKAECEDRLKCLARITRLEEALREIETAWRGGAGKCKTWNEYHTERVSILISVKRHTGDAG